MFQRVRVVTTTLAEIDDPRVGFAVRTIKAVRELTGQQLIIVDGSKPLTKGVFESAGAEVHDQVPGSTMGASRRQAIQLGLDAGAQVIVWLEPEKYPMVPFLPQLVAPVLSDDFHLVIPRRRSLQSYPAYQMAKELEGNWQAASMTGRPDLDLWSGPRIMNRRVAEIFTAYKGQYRDRWESIFVPAVWALLMDFRVGSVEVDYVHPFEQAMQEDGSPEFNRKRDVQLEDILAAISQAIAEFKGTSSGPV